MGGARGQSSVPQFVQAENKLGLRGGARTGFVRVIRRVLEAGHEPGRERASGGALRRRFRSLRGPAPV